MSLSEYGDLTLKEQVPMTRRRQAPVIFGEDYYKSTGATRSQEWSGPWEDVLAHMEALPASETDRLDALATRVADGDFGTLKATWTEYEFVGEEGAEASMPGSSREAPSYEVQTSAVQEPLLAHPKLAYLPTDYLTALKMIMDGYTMDDLITDSTTGTKVKLSYLLDQIPDQEVVKMVQQGVTHYVSPQVVVTCRYQASAVPSFPTLCSIVNEVPGPMPAAAAGRNWLFEGPSTSVQDGKIMVAETYRLSGPGGWNTFLYSEE